MCLLSFSKVCRLSRMEALVMKFFPCVAKFPWRTVEVRKTAPGSPLQVASTVFIKWSLIWFSLNSMRCLEKELERLKRYSTFFYLPACNGYGCEERKRNTRKRVEERERERVKERKRERERERTSKTLRKRIRKGQNQPNGNYWTGKSEIVKCLTC